MTLSLISTLPAPHHYITACLSRRWLADDKYIRQKRGERGAALLAQCALSSVDKIRYLGSIVEVRIRAAAKFLLGVLVGLDAPSCNIDNLSGAAFLDK